jgi:hypothetical protein
MEPSGWDALVVDRTASLEDVSEDDFRVWARGRRVFVSSCMDSEMNPSRTALREYLHKIGAIPVMWEELAPQDQKAEQAYTDGVDSSEYIVILVGSRYGQPDSTGYSPTHKEANRAEQRGIPRFLLKTRVTDPSTRAGRLNDFVNELQVGVSANSFSDNQELINLADARLREMASRYYAQWVKINSILVPASISSTWGNGERSLVVVGTSRDPSVRADLEALAAPNWGRNEICASWSNGFLVGELSGFSLSELNRGEFEFQIKINGDRNQSWAQAPGISLGGVSISTNGGTITPGQQVECWIEDFVFGPAPEPVARPAMLGVFYPGTAPVRDILTAKSIAGWAAEGVIAAYISEHIRGWFGCQVERLDVGPSVSTRVPVRIEFTTSGTPSERFRMTGFVPLP